MYAVGIAEKTLPHITWFPTLGGLYIQFKLVRVDGILYWTDVGFAGDIDGMLVLKRSLKPLPLKGHYLFEESDLE